MANLLVDAALKQVERDVQRVQALCSKVTIKRAIASVEALKASLKAI